MTESAGSPLGMTDPLTSRLRAALRPPLPGAMAHRIALPDGFEPMVARGARYRDAAVLIGLYRDPERGRVLFPLIRRPTSQVRHAGQIALPGGECNPGEGKEDCALREAEEEVGIASRDVTILGALSPIEIPITLYRVDPIVGWISSPPRFRMQESEVRDILLADPIALAASGPTLILERNRGRRTIRFPAWDVQGEKVWGATAQILGEFVEVWKRMPQR